MHSDKAQHRLRRTFSRTSRHCRRTSRHKYNKTSLQHRRTNNHISLTNSSRLTLNHMERREGHLDPHNTGSKDRHKKASPRLMYHSNEVSLLHELPSFFVMRFSVLYNTICWKYRRDGSDRDSATNVWLLWRNGLNSPH